MQQSKWASPGHDPPRDSAGAFNRESLSGARIHAATHSHPGFSGDMVVCSYYQRGTCRFGDQCKNEHPGSQRDANRGFGGGFGGSNTNRFGAFGGGDRYRPGQQSGGFGGRNEPKTTRFHLSKDDIKADLTDQRPIYPLSCYGPGRDAPRQLIEGPVEISPEELRLRYYTQRASGNEAVAQQEETELHNKMQQQVKTILDDLNGAIRYVEEGADIHPNRIDIAQGKVPAGAPANAPTVSSSSNPFSKPPSNPFGSGSQPQTSAFGQTSNSAFGQPRPTSFGQPSHPGQTTSAFGQPSNPGQAASAFGQASSLRQSTSGFGQPSALGGGGAFGKPSMPGSGAFGGSAFGKPSFPSSGSGTAFGQSSALGQQQSAFGQPSAPGAISTFGKSSAPAQTSAFGQSSALGQQNNPFSKPAFGQSGFSQPSQSGPNASPFGQQQPQANASPFAQAAQQGGNKPSPFSQQAQQIQQSNPFSQGQQPQQAQAQSNPFGGSSSSQSSKFGQPSKPAFGAPSLGTTQNQPTTQQQQNPFAQQTQNTAPAAAAASPFGTQAQSQSPFAQPQQQQSQSGAAGVAPGGKPIDPKDRFKEGKPEEYEGERGKILEEIYKRVGQLGRFNDDEEIPLTPPKCEWIVPVQML